MRSNVVGAEVFIDGQLKGLIEHDQRLKTSLNEGDYRVQLKKPGYQESSERQIEIAAKKETQLKVDLLKSEGPPVPLPTDGYLTVQSTPGASVLVDGKVSGTVGSDGNRLLKLPTGPHQLQINLDNYDSWSETVNMKSGEQLHRTALLRRKETPPPPAAAPTGDFTASQKTIEEGGTTRLSWTTQYATEISINPSISGSALSASGGQDVSPRETTTYTLTAKGKGGTYTAKLEVIVQPKAPPPPPPPPKKDESAKENTGVSSAVNAADVEGVKAVLEQYKAAYRDMIAEEFTRFWPNISDKKLKGMKATFSGANALSVTEECTGEPTISNDNAEWTCRETRAETVKGERQKHAPHTVQFLFKKIKGKWYMDGQTAQ